MFDMRHGKGICVCWVRKAARKGVFEYWQPVVSPLLYAWEKGLIWDREKGMLCMKACCQGSCLSQGMNSGNQWVSIAVIGG